MTRSRKPQQLIHPLSVVALAAFVIGLLITLFPKESLYADPHYNQTPDLLSVSYQKVLLAARPEDSRVRLNLATQLRKLGQMNAALEVLAPLEQDSSALDPEQRARFIRESLWSAHAALSQGDESQRERLRVRLFEALEQGWERDFLDEVTRPFLASLPIPDRIAFLTRRLNLVDQPEFAVDNLIELSEMARANADPGLEAILLEQAWTLTASDDPRRAGIEARRPAAALEASPEQALDTLQQLIQAYPEDRRWLDLGVEIALQNSALAWAIEWSEQARRSGDDSPERLSQLVDMTLASGDTHAALKYLEAWLSGSPESTEGHRRAAQLYSWSGNEAKALDHWEFVARHSGEADAVAATWQIALNRREPERAIAVLRRESVRRSLTEEEWQALAESQSALGRFDEARTALERAVRDNPQSRVLWEAWVRLAYQQRDAAAAIAGLQAIESTFGLRPEEVLLLAAKFRQVGETARGHAVLREHEAVASAGWPEYWLLRAELAQSLGLTDDRDSSLEQLPDDLTRGSDSERLQRVVFLLNARGTYDAAAELAEQGFATTREPALLLLALENASAAADRARVERLLARLQSEGIPIDENAGVWAIRAVLAASQGQLETADQAWTRARTLSPERLDYQLAQVWLHIDHADRFERPLRRELQRLGREAQPPREIVDVLAQGWHRLGNAEEAAVWFSAGLNDHRKDWQWIRAYAENLERQGEHARAAALEREALALLSEEIAARTASAGALTGEADQRYFAQQLQQYLLLSHRHGDKAQAEQTNLALLQRHAVSACCDSGEPGTTADLVHVARGLGRAELDRQLTIQGMQWALEADSELDIRQYEMLAAAGDVRLPAWQQLALGLRQRDGYRVRQVLVEAREELPMADQMLALEQIGSRSESLALARRVVNTTPSDTLRDVAVASDILQRQGEAWQVSARHDAFGVLETNAVAARYRTLVGDSPMALAVEAASIRSDEPGELKPEAGLEQRIDLRADLALEVGGIPMDLRTTLRATDGRLLPGLGLTTRGRDTLGIDHEVTVYAAQPTELTAALSVAGQESGVRYAGGWQATDTTRFSAELNLRHLMDVDYDNLGQGHGLTALLTQELLGEPDRLTARLAHQHADYQADADLSAHLREHFDVLAAADALFPDRFERSSVGLAFGDGWLHHLMPVASARGWRTLADVESGYEWRDGGWDFGVRLGAGVPLWGHDELALSLGWNEAAESGEQRRTALLTYSRSLEAR